MLSGPVGLVAVKIVKAGQTWLCFILCQYHSFLVTFYEGNILRAAVAVARISDFKNYSFCISNSHGHSPKYGYKPQVKRLLKWVPN